MISTTRGRYYEDGDLPVCDFCRAIDKCQCPSWFDNEWRNATVVKKVCLLREKTGLGVMECKIVTDLYQGNNFYDGSWERAVSARLRSRNPFHPWRTGYNSQSYNEDLIRNQAPKHFYDDSPVATVVKRLSGMEEATKNHLLKLIRENNITAEQMVEWAFNIGYTTGAWA